MSADKRTVMTDALETLGMIIGHKEKRDAIHLAVEPTIAHVQLWPGQHVALLPDWSAVHANEMHEAVGIVDPFLKHAVQPGERFWLVLYPRQISSLRHVWEHSKFRASELSETEVSNDATKAASKQWIESFGQTFGVSYGALIDHAKDYVEAGEYWVQGDRFISESIPDEFWVHYENVTGEKVDIGDRGNFLSCSC